MKKNFVAINYIKCEDHYSERFEQLFATRAQAIDRMPGFLNMEVLKPNDQGEYLIVSHWESEGDIDQLGPAELKLWQEFKQLESGAMNYDEFQELLIEYKSRELASRPRFEQSIKARLANYIANESLNYFGRENHSESV